MSFDNCLGLYNMNFSVVIEESVECFKYFRWSKIKLIQDDPVALPYSFNESSLSEYKLTLVRSVRYVTP